MSVHVAEAFAGKRVLMIGVDTTMARELAQIFRSVGADTVTSGDADLVVASPAAVVQFDPSSPLLVVGPLDDLPQHHEAEHFDFVIAPPLRSDEVRSITDIEALDSVDIAAEGRFVIRDPWSLQIRAGAGRQRLPSGHQRHTAGTVLLGIRF